MTLVKKIIMEKFLPQERHSQTLCVCYVPSLLEMNEFCTLYYVCTGRYQYIGHKYLDNPARYDRRAKHPAMEYSLNHFLSGGPLRLELVPIEGPKVELSEYEL